MTYLGAPLMSDRQDWGTPDSFMDYLKEKFDFTPDLDACASEENSKAPAWFSKSKPVHFCWTHQFYENVWMNPPFGNKLSSFIDKIEMQYNGGQLDRAFILVPARTDTKWFHKMMKGNVSVCYFIRGRFNFVHPDLNCAGANAPFPSILVVWDRYSTPQTKCKFDTLELTPKERGF